MTFFPRPPWSRAANKNNSHQPQPIMSNTILDHTPATFVIEGDHVLRLVADKRDFEEMQAALAEYDALQRTAGDLLITHQAEAVRAKLQAAGINVLDDSSFREVFLKRMTDEDTLRNQCWQIDVQIVGQLTQRASSIVRRLRQKAVDMLEGEIKAQAARSEDVARCERFNLSESAAYNGCYNALRAVREDLMARLNDDVNLTLSADRRGTLGRYFSKPL
jgi:hypothetical protein